MKQKQKPNSMKRFIKNPKVLLITVLLLLFLVGTGYMQFAFAYIKCGKSPIIANSFAASYSYKQPGDKRYGPTIVSKYFCSISEADKAGYSPAAGTDLDKQRFEEFLNRE